MSADTSAVRPPSAAVCSGDQEAIVGIFPSTAPPAYGLALSTPVPRLNVPPPLPLLPPPTLTGVFGDDAFLVPAVDGETAAAALPARSVKPAAAWRVAALNSEVSLRRPLGGVVVFFLAVAFVAVFSSMSPRVFGSGVLVAAVLFVRPLYCTGDGVFFPPFPAGRFG